MSNSLLNRWIWQTSPADLGNIPLTALLLKGGKKNHNQRRFPPFMNAGDGKPSSPAS